MTPVQLYVYDLSRGMAAQLSQQLTGRYIEGIWHTSIVFHGKEWYYGAGINWAAPGRTHLGKPLRVIDLGESGIDEETFHEYVNEMRGVYTADKYHLLEFNCNSFTNDVAGFLTGGSIPRYISDLPTDFLNTPFGQALRPTIDQMYQGPNGSAGRAPPPSDALASAILQGVAANAAGTPTQSNGAIATQTLTAPIQICTNPTSFETIKRRHKAVVAFFTSQTCAPCKVVEPVFEELAHSKATPSIAFVKIDMSVGMGYQVGQQNGAHATPTFQFFLDGKKVHEVKGANAPELRTQTDLLIYDAFPPHPHAKLRLPALRAVPLNPILFTQVPKLDALSAKFLGALDDLELSLDQKTTLKTMIAKEMIPHLKAKLSKEATAPSVMKNASALVSSWTNITNQTAGVIPPLSLFPLVDLWRLAVLIPDVANYLSTSPTSPLPSLLKIAADSASSTEVKNLTLTALRLSCNLFSNAALTRRMLNQTPYPDVLIPRNILTDLLIPALLSDAANVRVAAASLAFNVSAFLQTPLMAAFNKGQTGQMKIDEAVDDLDWVVELLSAVVEAVGREDSEDSLHRLVTCLGLLVHLSPHLEEVRSLLEVLQAKEMLQLKLKEKGLVQKGPVRKLIQEIVDELC